MSKLEDVLTEAERHIVYDDFDNTGVVHHEVFDVLRALVDALKEADRHPPGLDGMSRTDALRLAREHVEAMSTNARGYQDGVKLSDKVAAMETFARFLMGESE
ncbi:hypothetical protein ABT096_29735 [Streptomyces sp. NPDC002561]|uniref:hypothetical protein n=1 Tax=Streptomyces sp. NPDC002561 TaxID=3154418 RepID=UPI0033306781